MDRDEILALAKDAELSCSIAEIVEDAEFMANPHLARTKDGAPKKPTVPALVWWLEHPSMGLSHVRYNALEGVIDAELLPWSRTRHAWSDADTSFLLADLQQRTGGLVSNEGYVVHALTIMAHNRSYDPLVDMLDTLPDWDGVHRADTLIIDYLGAIDTPYTRAVTRHMLNGAVMRGYMPGCKFDDVVTLSSKSQGIGKSTFTRKLAMRDDFFTDSLGSITTKEAPENLQGRWIVEIGELEGLRKREVESVKSFLSRQDDRYRAAYGRFSETRKRRNIFIATTNSQSFLIDKTGNRRFLPIECGLQPTKLDIFADDAIGHIRMAWSEVVDEFKRDGSLPLVLPAEIRRHADRVTEHFTVADAKEGLIAAWVDSRRPNERICILQVFEDVLEIPRCDANKPSNKALMNEVSQILDLMPTLRRLDGKPKHSDEYGQQRCWVCNPSR